MNKGFVLEEGPITNRLKHFDDVHLLKLPENRPEGKLTLDKNARLSNPQLKYFKKQIELFFNKKQ